ncbi:MAG: hypothetical protein J6P66_09275 [Bacteroidaceae bacterium]|nr:hypothetical protein [Bacteroidaceae bacterium]
MKRFILARSSAMMKTKRELLFAVTMFAVSFLMNSCSSRIHEIPDYDDPDKVQVNIKVNSIEQIPFSSLKTKASVQDVCTKLSYAVFSEVGESGVKEDFAVQNIDDPMFGTVSLKLGVGKHYLAVVGQNGGDGNPSFTTNPANTTYNTASIRYSSGNKNTPKVLDTFHYCGEINVEKGGNTYQINLDRSVAMFRLKLTDNIPEQVSRVEFEYSNGSATLDVLNGYGCVNTKQIEAFDVDPSTNSFELYTFPQRGKTVMKVKVKAYDVDGNVYYERSWDDIPMTVNRVSQYTGVLFPESGIEYADAGLAISVNDNWSGIYEQTF